MAYPLDEVDERDAVERNPMVWPPQVEEMGHFTLGLTSPLRLKGYIAMSVRALVL